MNLNGTPTDYTDDTWTDRDVYNYDNVGNRTRKRVYLAGSSTPTTDDVYTYLAGNGDLLEKIERNGALFREYDYDLVGRTTAVWKSGVGTTTYSYNEDSRLTGITYPGPSSDSMTYNGVGARVSRTENGVTNDYIRDGVSVTDPVLADSGATYTPGISERRGGVTKYGHSGLKNMDAQSDSSQSVASTRRYDAWGNTRSTTGTWSGPFGHAGGFGYQSSDRSGLQLLGHRYYDPETGRFMTSDPIGDGTNWSVYGAGVNSPLDLVDPDGLQAMAGALPFAGGAAAIDGPFPIGDAVGIVVLAGAGLFDLYNVISRKRKGKAGKKPRAEQGGAEHTNNARPSTLGKHQRGTARKGRDRRGGEKGDARRYYAPVPGDLDPSSTKSKPIRH